VAVNNANGVGVYISGGTNNTLSKILTTNTSSRGIYVFGTDGDVGRNTFNHVTVANAPTGIQVESGGGGADNSTVNQIVSTNTTSGYGGIYLYGVSNAKLSQGVFAHHADAGINSFGLSSALVTNNILLGNNLYSCEIDGTPSGIAGFRTDCSNDGSSNANFIQSSSVDLTSAFVGKITLDSSNASHSSGTASYASITDWLNFDHQFRGWGLDGSAFPNADHATSCASGNTCRIWDWSLSSSDTVIRNRSNDGSTANADFVAGSTCPAAVHGNKALTDGQSTANTFLVNALEILGDEIGDDDGLCESSEACIYSPNFGAYQGHGDYLAAGTCTFQNGTVTGVQMYAYPTNGR
jgi:hypothetical protein